MAVPPRKPTRPVSAVHADAAPASPSTRTSSRSAKRRSPKEPEQDPELIEYERTEFLRAIDRYKRRTGKTFPSWTEVLDVLRSLGWVSPAKLEAERRKATPIG
ncbi:MAG: hypothetical protein FJ296_03370 [Planctomycetes bacterium]|nr:hypothetical protein [Planctomycetota bacterium]